MKNYNYPISSFIGLDAVGFSRLKQNDYFGHMLTGQNQITKHSPNFGVAVSKVSLKVLYFSRLFLYSTTARNLKINKLSDD